MTKKIFSLRDYDRYGSPISLFYLGESTYKTYFGGILSIISTILIVSCLLFKAMH